MYCQKWHIPRDYEGPLTFYYSKMTFAHLSQATAASQRFYHRTQHTFNRIQNTYLTIEIHNQGA